MVTVNDTTFMLYSNLYSM